MRTSSSSELFHLDTNLFVHAVRGDATWQKIKAEFNPLMAEPIPCFSVITEGELLSIAEQRNWNDLRRSQMLFLLGYFRRFDISTQEIFTAYATMDNFSRRRGIRMGKNDLWIAATAHALEATLLTTDKDFDHLHGELLTRILIEEVR